MVRQTRIVNMSLSAELYAVVDELAKQRGVSRSLLLKEALEMYVAEQRRWQLIRRWGEETAGKLGLKDEQDVNRVIHEFRREQAKPQ